jgi:RND family efflux transporter MFP subunit
VNRLKVAGWLLLIVAMTSATGCGRRQERANAEPPPPEVQVGLPVVKDVTDYEDFPGRTEAINTIDVRARVTGHLDRVLFKDGADVKEGQVLFEIDRRLYDAELARAEANVVQAQARMDRLTQDFARARELLAKKAISQEEYDKIAGDRSEANASVGVAVANRRLAQQNVDFCQICAPIHGRISRRYMDPGNLVRANDSVLTTIVSVDPMYAYFDVDERATLRLQELAKAQVFRGVLLAPGRINIGGPNRQTVLMGLANEDGFSRRGHVDFSDNRVDPDTGTWRLRGVFPNPSRGLSSGLFVHIRLPIGAPYRALLVSEQALGADQGQRFVYVVDDEGKARYRRVTLGRLHEGLRVISDGIKPGENIIVSGLQRVRPNAKVNPQLVSMTDVGQEKSVKGSDAPK